MSFSAFITRTCSSSASLPWNPNILRQVSDQTQRPGSTVKWEANWPHTTGPMMTYMASYMRPIQLLRQPKAPVQIPSHLAPVNYLMRHEIIALRLSVSIGGAEFYPACAQLHIGGSQTGAPQASNLVSLPGAHKDTNPGIYDPNVYEFDSMYTFPGPPIASFTSRSSGSGSQWLAAHCFVAGGAVSKVDPDSSGLNPAWRKAVALVINKLGRRNYVPPPISMF
ncbi:Glycosyl hydrolase family 61 domain containing protein [Amanita muscaria]